MQGDLFLDAALNAAALSAAGPKGGGAPFDTPGLHPAGRQLSTGLTPADGARMGLHEAVGTETEVRAALRQIVAAKIPLDQVEIAYTTAVPYLSLLLDAVQVYELPAAFATGVPARLTAPGRALGAFLRWLAADLDAAELVEACRAGCLQFPRTDATGEAGDTASPQPVPASRVASLLRAGRAGRGRGAGAAALERLLGRIGWAEGEEARLERQELERARAQVMTLEALVPVAEPAGERAADLADGDPADGDLAVGDIALSAVAAAGRAFLEAYAPTGIAERDRRTAESLRDRLSELGGGGRGADARAEAAADERGTLTDMALLLLSLVDEHTADASVARGGALYVVPLERAGYCARPHLWVLGMDESHFPGAAVEDPVLLDTERAALSPSLPLERDRPGERVWHYLRAAGACPGRVELVAGRLDLADGREPYPSPLFEHAREQLGVDPTPHRPAPPAERALDAAELALATRGSAGLSAWVSEAYPWLVEGRRAARARRQEALTRFEGWAGPEWAGAGADSLWSAARLETLARCPYRYFLRYTLGASPLEDDAAAPGQWLTALERGQLLHDVYHTFLQGLVARGQRPDFERHAADLEAGLEAAATHLRQRLPAPSEVAYGGELEGLRRSAAVFLRAEARRLSVHPGLEPVAFELGFGFGASDAAGGGTEPVEIALSDAVRLRLRGRIDRVDRIADGGGTEYEIWDYKTGSTHGFDAADPLAGGTVLQWALYAHVLPHLLPGRVRVSGYFFASERGRGQRFAAPPPSADDLAAVLEPLLDLAREGAFPHCHKAADECRFCDFERVCAGEALGARDVAARVDATRHLHVFAEQMEELDDREAQTHSRQTMSGYLAGAGLQPGDLVPGAVLEALEDWMAAGLVPGSSAETAAQPGPAGPRPGVS